MPQNVNPLNENQTCPHCHRSNVTLHELPEVTFLFLKNHSMVDLTLNRACKFCIEDFERFRNSPTVYLDKLKAEADEKKNLWNGRGDALKAAYKLFQSSNYKEAEPKYREYIGVIEKVFSVTLTNISPQIFVNRGYPDELSTFTLVLWDMVVVCDQNVLPDTQVFANKFIEMARGSIARSTLIHSIKKYRRRAKNKKLFKQILIDLRGDTGCFIATHIYANAYSPEVMLLRQFRDQKLMPSRLGRAFVRLYYSTSPKLIRMFPKKIARTTFVRKIIRALIYLLRD